MSELDEEIKAFVKERDTVLMTGDIDKVMAFHRKHNPLGSPLAREIVEIGMHKARTAALSLPLAERVKSRKWLSSRGYGHGKDEG
jgi:hypothetical protein